MQEGDVQRALVSRRLLMRGGLSFAFVQHLFEPAYAQTATSGDKGLSRLGPVQQFNFELLRSRARDLARAPYEAPQDRYSDLLNRIGYDAHLNIKSKPEYAVWNRTGSISADFFHLGNLFRHPVSLHVVSGGIAREILYQREGFLFGDAASFARTGPDDLGFAGVRLRARTTGAEIVAFLGASYFRAPGQSAQYGLSARAVAVDTGLDKREEFPRFRAFWLERSPNGRTANVYALLDGPSLTGAYRFKMIEGTGHVFEVDASLYFRDTVSKFGVAPLTSMFWYGKHNRSQATDWRPEIHDSDGLALWTGSGERIWRPLNNPLSIQVNNFFDRNPKGFGLMQRERAFSNYEDTGARYDKRPSLWIEPLDAWGAGSVELVEFPTAGEFNDNIVAYWRSHTTAVTGSEFRFRYRMHWRDHEPFRSPLARVVATRTGSANVRDGRSTKFVVDFEGNAVSSLSRQRDGVSQLKFVVSASRGLIEDAHSFPIAETGRWRGVFELMAVDSEPVVLRGYLRVGNAALTETWMHSFYPVVEK